MYALYEQGTPDVLRLQSGRELAAKELGRFGKAVLLLPDQIDMGGKLRLQRPKAEGAVRTGINQLVQAKRISQAFFYHEGSIVEQIISGNDVQVLRLFLQPVIELMGGE